MKRRRIDVAGQNVASDKIRGGSPEPLLHQELLEPELWTLARVMAASEKIIPAQMVVLYAKGLGMMADFVFVVKITELLLPNGENPQLEPTASSLLPGDGLVLVL